MFTLKHITPMGSEKLVETERVSYAPNEPATSGPQGAVWYMDDDGSYKLIDDGTVYVMNGHGSTIAKYDLGPAGAAEQNGDPRD